MKNKKIEKIKYQIQEWAKQYPQIVLADIEIYPSTSVPNVFHVIVVASKGFENWEQSDQENDLYWFLQKRIDKSENIFITVLLALTEEESEKYERVFVE